LLVKDAPNFTRSLDRATGRKPIRPRYAVDMDLI
jgi:hypothetical protein